MERKSPSLRAYRAALQRYIDGRDEVALAQAYELGRAGLHAGAGVIHIVQVHSTAVTSILATATDDRDVHHRIHASTEFLVEALSPFEMAYRGYCDLMRAALASAL